MFLINLPDDSHLRGKMPVLLMDVRTNGIIKKHDKSGLYKAQQNERIQQIHAHFGYHLTESNPLNYSKYLKPKVSQRREPQRRHLKGIMKRHSFTHG